VPKLNIITTNNNTKKILKLLTYVQTKPNVTKAWFTGGFYAIQTGLNNLQPNA